jgi:hypothetical protein
VILALLLGFLTGIGNVVVAAVPFVIASLIVLVFFPWLFIWILLVSALTILGIIRLYAPEYQIVRWIYPPIALGLPLAIIILQPPGLRVQSKEELPALYWWILAFLVVTFLFSLVNWHGVPDLMLGLKVYFQVWGFLFAFALIRYHGDFARGMRILLLAIAFLQVPFVIQQWFVVMPQRVAYGLLSADDVIAGTFGADLYGGGNNALLSAYLIMAIGLLISMWRERIIRVWWLIASVLFLVFPVFLNETKIAFFYFWLMFLVLYWREVTKRPVHFLFGNILLAIFLFFFVFIYAHFAAGAGHHIQGMADYLGFVKQQNLELGYGLYTLNRWTALTFWFSQHFPHDILHSMIGHGLGESQEGGAILTAANNLASRRYHGMGIGVTAISALLWDVGIIGLAMVCLVFVSAFRLAGRLARDNKGNANAVALFNGMQVSIAILFLSLAHKSFFVFELTFQSLFVLIIGFLIYSARFSPRQR